MDALSTWFADKENPANATKQPLLKELFKLAKQEERFKNTEIGEFTHTQQDNSQQVLTASRSISGCLCNVDRENVARGCIGCRRAWFHQG